MTFTLMAITHQWCQLGSSIVQNYVSMSQAKTSLIFVIMQQSLILNYNAFLS